MVSQRTPGDVPKTCPSCRSPVEPGFKFCDICGEEIEKTPTCPECGAQFITPVKYCEVCGSPLDPAERPAGRAEEAAEVPEIPEEIPEIFEDAPEEPGEVMETLEEITEEPEEAMETPEEPEEIPAEEPEPPLPIPRKKPGPAGAAKTVATSPRLPDPEPAEPAPTKAKAKAKTPVNTRLIAGGIIVLLIIIAGIWFAGLPLLKGAGARPLPAQAETTPLGTPTPEPTLLQTTVPTTLSAPVPTATVNPLATIPIQVLPKGQEIFFQVQKDPVTSRITVIFAGGPGINAINTADVRVTHADGTVTTGLIQPSQGITEITLAGTKDADRVEVLANLHNGQSYRVVDEMLSYKARS